jgi:hypothetical protein
LKTRLHILGLCCLGLLFQGCPKTESALGNGPEQQNSPSKVLEYSDQVYEPNVRTVQFYRGTDPFSYPILYLGDDTKLKLEFDILQPAESRTPDYWIEVVSCDHDWTPSGLLPLEFIEGFSSDRMYDYTPSQNTLIPYIHYRYEFPAEGSSFKKSGNYLLKVFRSGDENDLLLTRRLVVADHKIGVEPLIGQSRMAADRRRLQRVDFNLQLTHQFPGIFDPRQDLKVYILQNFRWDNAVGGLQPMFTNPTELQYQFDAANNFEGGNEFRLLDIRSTRFKTAQIKEISNADSVYRFTLFTDEPRLSNLYYSKEDLNGNYAIDVQEYPNAAFEADYTFVRFGLKLGEPLTDGEVYVHGKFNDWRLDSTNQLSYNAAALRYEGELLLKQGVYDYHYIVQRRKDKGLDEARLEGSHAETENYYTILVYYKPIGARGSELIGMSHVNFYER